MQINTNPEDLDKILNRGIIKEILPSKKEFRQKMLSGEKLRFYIGFDATSPTLHLSHAKNFMLLEEFRKLGHEVIVLFGDFTARIGDPTDKKTARKQLSSEEVMANVKEWKRQVEPLMDFKTKENPPLVKYNSKWLSRLNFEEVISLASNFTVQGMLERDMFEKRMKEGNPIYLHEFLYPLMQGYDSVAMEVDVEMCGTDQIFNALVGRTLSKRLLNKEKFVVAVTLMENPATGEMMSKSKGTGVFLNNKANVMFGEVMSQPDEMIENLFICCTRVSLKDISEILKLPNPKDAKMKLAYEIVKLYYGEKEAKKAQEEFIKVFQKKENPEDIEEFPIKEDRKKLVDIIFEAKLTSSKGEARRLIEQGAVKIDSEVEKKWDKEIEIKDNMVIQAGKRKFIKIVK